jgi:RimJ/RimL family protein N-acetyltransferase/acetyl esterase/lipase
MAGGGLAGSCDRRPKHNLTRANPSMQIFLETERLVLRRFTDDDIDDLVELDSDPEVMRFINGGRPTPRDEIENEVLPAYLRYYERYDGYGFWAAVERSTGRFVGWFHFRPAEGAPPDEVELGYRLRKSAWGKGYATEGSRALIDKGFAELGVQRVIASTMVVNIASRRVMEKAGLRFVRIFHQPWPDYIEGEEEGDVEYALLRSEWEQATAIRSDVRGPPNYEVEYDNGRRVPEVGAISARWRAASAAYRETAHAELDQRYGSGERHFYDLFFTDTADAPLVVYVHGGYWQQGDRTLYSFLARELNASGLTVAVPSYSLCPTVSVLDIVGELRACLAALWKRTGTHPLVIGHSAGGHLTAAMVATDWDAIADVPDDLVRAGIAISGIFDLRPLVVTSINNAIGLDLELAPAASPAFWPPPPKRRALVAAVGGAESAEFLRQSREIVERWDRVGLDTEYLETPGANHFTIVDELAQPQSALFGRVLAMARRVYTPEA